jgi:hypothetical protein
MSSLGLFEPFKSKHRTQLHKLFEREKVKIFDIFWVPHLCVCGGGLFSFQYGVSAGFFSDRRFSAPHPLETVQRDKLSDN